jgi:hypothetical protein
MFDFEQTDSNVTVCLVLDGKEYELSQFKINFGQGIDYKGQPQDEVRGGRIMVTLTQIVPDNIYRWGMTSMMENGEIVFRSKTTNAPIRIIFENAYCVSFERDISGAKGLSTTLIISSEFININGINFDNHWTS